MNIIPPVAAIPTSLSSSQLDGNIMSAVADFRNKITKSGNSTCKADDQLMSRFII